MSERATAENCLLHDFAADTSKASIAGPAWLDGRRARALRNFRAQGVPHRRIEDWKYTDLRGAIEAGEPGAETRIVPAANDRFPHVPGLRLTISDGALSGDWKARPAPAGLEVFDLGKLNEDAPDWIRNHLGRSDAEVAMSAAALALMHGGVALRVTGAHTDPLHLQIMQTNPAAARHARILLLLEPGASLTLLESRSGGETALMNVGVEIIVEPNAQLHHVRLAGAAPEAIHVEEIAVRVERAGRYHATLLQQGARLSRLGLSILLGDEEAEAHLNGASLLSGDLHADITTRIDHAKGRTTSRQLFKKVVGGKARAIYQGKIVVHKGANGSDSRQTAKAILLGARAEADLKPELEILADDVKCAHGAAIGDLDQDSLFYLRSRGLPESEARTLLIRGFLEETLTEIDREDVRGCAWQFLESGLALAAEMQS